MAVFLSLSSVMIITLALTMMALPSTTAFTIHSQITQMMIPTHSISRTIRPRSLPTSPTTIKMSSWDDFGYDDDDELLDSPVDADFVAADENDDQSVKAAAGASLVAPEVDWEGEAIEVPQGSQLALDAETVQGVLAACRQEIGTMFGYQAENRGVGITGGVDFVDLDGPTVVLHLKGRFWHQRPTVLSRVGSYLQARIPEIVDVVVEDEWELTDEANEQAA
mmetsp:Transcript_26783/g.49237  ORF Transcript_26783/g.49237 Transcript_26783/m.49237 type:complete len:222 (-) Transcript_26783:124-789(-)|eukprot:CAMPEP_0201884642 /NCGR_PEP_ID=MMETSP0902-20130614/17473_1 /ASSEMBLY_ACC=CAM_ASM_000551 /TAXON_ID=420261 /ORGANISM="Thalassiosira antarctica, Strain CCMP982" /LENGTH=221 /DNA_ID=CAMNT_0048413639 /DNA_START=71 /DNA_END=736 /DNA_ORIENTATION=+